VKIWQTTLGPEPAHPHAAAAVNNLASALAMRGAHEEARIEFERACRMWEATLGPDNIGLVDPLWGLTDARLALGRHAEASESAARALALQQAAGLPESALAYTRFLQAKAAWGLAEGSEHAAALSQAREARGALADATDPEGVRRREEIDRWLAEVAPP
jgi:tetratricopeptide (TPR) repeat protein